MYLVFQALQALRPADFARNFAKGSLEMFVYKLSHSCFGVPCNFHNPRPASQMSHHHDK